ncbi:hypothetical protein ACSBR1_001056 [Camellia fascicularis]
MTYDQLSGSIPQDVGTLRSLIILDLSKNNPTGSVPVSIGNLATLTFLSLFKNHLSGPIPQEVGMLRSLITLDLSANNLTGLIPLELGKLNSLTYFTLHENKLTGSVPSELDNLTHLQIFDISNNMLTEYLNKLKTQSLTNYWGVRGFAVRLRPKEPQICHPSKTRQIGKNQSVTVHSSSRIRPKCGRLVQFGRIERSGWRTFSWNYSLSFLIWRMEG